MIPDELKEEMVTNMFNEIIMNMSEKDQIKARIEFDEILNREIKKRLDKFDNTTNDCETSNKP